MTYHEWQDQGQAIAMLLDVHRGGWHLSDVLHFQYAMQVEQRSLDWIRWDISGRAGTEPTNTPPVTPPANVNLTSFPRRGATIAAGLLLPDFDMAGWLAMLGNIFGSRAWTQFNVFSARWPGLERAVWPWLQRPDGKFDLYAKNPAFWNDKLPRTVELANRYSVLPQFCLVNLYQFSDRKPDTPDKSLDPFRHNVNGVYWRGDDDFLANELQNDPFLLWFCGELGAALRGSSAAIVPFNEGPEKDLHYAIADAIRTKWPDARMVYNRNDDTPGQYQNQLKRQPMGDMIAFHGWKDLGFLKESFAPTAREKKAKGYDPKKAAQRPWTFQEFFDNRHHNGNKGGYDFTRVVVSSDGSRISSDPVNTYNWPELLKVFQFCAKKGCTIEHQSRAKMTLGAPLSMVEVDFLKQIAAL